MSDHTPWIYDVTEANFERLVLEESHRRPVVVDFWAQWCGPCLALGPVLEQLINERQGAVVLAKVNVDEEQGLAGAFGISGIPAVKAFLQGQLVLEFEGLLPEEQLREFLDRLSPTEADQLVTQAREQEESNPAEAERLYREAIEHESNSTTSLDLARLGLARVLLAQGKADEIDSILEPVGSEGEIGAEVERIKAQRALRQIDNQVGDEETLRQRLAENPEDARTRFELGCALATRQQYPDALEMLLSAGERDPVLAAKEVREVMVQIFNQLGPNHPLSNDYRSRLSLLLY